MPLSCQYILPCQFIKAGMEQGSKDNLNQRAALGCGGWVGTGVGGGLGCIGVGAVHMCLHQLCFVSIGSVMTRGLFSCLFRYV